MSAMKKKHPFRIQISEDHEKTLHEIGSRYNMTGNAIVAAAAAEMARIRPENLWHALSRIADEEIPAALPAPDGRRKALKHESAPALV
jgi:hypothetical protein